MNEVAKDAEPARSGRPRRFEPSDEKAMLMDAALRAIGRDGYSAMTVNAVLEEAGLSTRAFYRHFDSKESLLVAVQEQEMNVVEGLLERAVESAPNPIAAVDAWLEQLISFYYPPWRDVLVPLFFAGDVNSRYRDRAHVIEKMRDRFCQPLVKVLRKGTRLGVLDSPSPSADAHCIHAIVDALTSSKDGRFPPRSEAEKQIARFAKPAIGLPVTTRPRAGSKC